MTKSEFQTKVAAACVESKCPCDPQDCACKITEALECQHLASPGMKATAIDWARLLSVFQAILPILLTLFANPAPRPPVA